MLQFKYSSLINAPVEVVWKFYERPDVLKILIPPWQPVQAIRREGGLGVGAITEFRMFLGLLPLTWVERRTECKQYHSFTDEQLSGPFEYWQHRHLFETEGNKTRLTDAIAFSLPGAEAIEFIAGWTIQAQLDAMFRYRHEATKRECETR